MGLGKTVAAQANMQIGSLARNLLVNYDRTYNFYVELNGMAFSFSKVSGLENTINMNPIMEGGYNGYVHQMRNSDSGHRVLTLEYGASNLNVMMDMLQPGRYLPKGVYIASFGHSSILSKRCFSLDGCYLQKIDYGDFDAERSEVRINKMEIVYSKITVK